MNLLEAQARVQRWHVNQGLPSNRTFIVLHDQERAKLESLAGDLGAVYEKYKDWFNCECMKRALLGLGEMIESVEAMAKYEYSIDSRVEIADALGDRLFVLLGDSVTFDIPLDEVLEEIMLSNETKIITQTDVRGKNHSGYRDPNLHPIIQGYDPL